MSSSAQAVVQALDDELEKTLKELREFPTVDAPSDVLLTRVFTRLLNEPSGTKQSHWFCEKASPLISQCATFLIRLFAYDASNTAVTQYKAALGTVLTTCSACVDAYLEAKSESRTTYFGAFESSRQEHFFNGVDTWEAELLEVSASSPPVSTPLLYLLLSSPSLIFHSKAQKLLQSPLPPNPNFLFKPPCVALLVFHPSVDVRGWSTREMKSSDEPSPRTYVKSSYESMTSKVFKHIKDLHDMEDLNPLPLSGDIGNLLSSNLTELWAHMGQFLAWIPKELIAVNPTCKTPGGQVVIMVLGHLHDTGPHFSGVLRAFLYLLKSTPATLWKSSSIPSPPSSDQSSTGKPSPSVIFDAIKDNPAFLRLLENHSSSADLSWSWSWFAAYLKSIPLTKLDYSSINKHEGSFNDVLAKMTSFSLGELRHSRFKSCYPLVVAMQLQAMRSFIIAPDEADTTRRTSEVQVERYHAVESVFDVHVDLIVSIAFSKDYVNVDDVWSSARQAARGLIGALISSDTRAVITSIQLLAAAVAGRSDASAEKLRLELGHIRPRLLQRMRDSIHTRDQEAIRMAMSNVAALCSYDEIRRSAFNIDDPEGKKHLKTINLYLTETRNGFVSLATAFCDLSSATSLKSFLEQSDVVRQLVGLILSPHEGLQNAALAIVGQAYDVDLRSECLRALMEHYFEQTLDGLISALTRFNAHADSLPEACGYARTLVRALADACDVLCNQPGGLLYDPQFRKRTLVGGHEVKFADLWQHMTAAIAVVFRRTPNWAAFYEAAEMVTWMRDALIFGRDLLTHLRTMQSAMTSVETKTGTSSNRLSDKSLQMVENLQPVLAGIVRWLRLTDVELLHQSVKLIESLFDAFKRCRVVPSEEALQKLEKCLHQAQTQTLHTHEYQRSRLTSTQISWLLAKLDGFRRNDKAVLSSDDEVVILPGPPAVQPKKSKGITDTRAASVEVRKSLSHPISNTLKERTRSQSPLTSTRVGKVGISKGANHTKLLDSKRVPPRPSDSNHTPPAVGSNSTLPGFRVVPRTAAADADSSSSEEDSDSDGVDTATGLNILTDLQKSPKKVRRGIKMIDGPIKKVVPLRGGDRQHYEAQRTIKRLKPDTSALYRLVLSWDYDHSGEIPPGFDEIVPHLCSVPDRFTSPAHYMKVFEPLLALECWCQLMKSKEEDAEIVSCRVVSKAYVDAEIELGVSIPQTPRPEWFVSETDIILLRTSPAKPGILARVIHSKKGPQTLVTLRCLSHVQGKMDIGGVDQTLVLVKVLNLVTVHREYAALKALEYYDLLGDILSGKLATRPAPTPSDIAKTMTSQKVNEPQAVAILSALQTSGFALIQGPPGTGKTSTIRGLIGSFLSTRATQATTLQPGRVANSADKQPKKKVLLCAPSNVAIDEVARRIRDGVFDGKGQLVVPNVVRIGTDSSVNISTKDISLDNLVDQKLQITQGVSSVTDITSKMASLRADMDTVKARLQEKRKEEAQLQGNLTRSRQLVQDIMDLSAERQRLSQSLNRVKDEQNKTGRNLDASRRQARMEILLDADVICSTLSGAAHDILDNLDFEMVIIDEAAQAIELSSLIPLRYQCTRCVLVGDPKQLPPTVISPIATKYKYNHSLFTRIEHLHPNAVHLLSIQYRMHPDISQLPSSLFYNGRLVDGPDMSRKTSQPWHASTDFRPYRFFDVESGNEEPGTSHSLINKAECNTAVALYNRLKREYSHIDFDFRIGIVSMYRAQIREMRRIFRARFGDDILERIDFNTVDGFQGQEKDIIILSCVRGGPGVTSVGFLRDERRMNVAITRSKSSLFILGNAATLERSDDVWRQIVGDARARDCLIKVGAGYFERPVTPKHQRTVASPFKDVKRSTSKSTPKPPSPFKKPDPVTTPAMPASIFPIGRQSSIVGPSETIRRSASTDKRETLRPVDTGTVKNQTPSVSSYARSTADPTANEVRKKSMHPPKKKDPQATMFIPRKRPLPTNSRREDIHPSVKRREIGQGEFQKR